VESKNKQGREHVYEMFGLNPTNPNSAVPNNQKAAEMGLGLPAYT
jgi:hypothetical protein